MLNIAIRAARKAGNVIAQKGYRHRDTGANIYKKSNDYVTNIDKASGSGNYRKLSKSHIRITQLLPKKAICWRKDNDVQWVIDPLDGTTNFVKGLPHFSVYCYSCQRSYRGGCSFTIRSAMNYLPQPVRGEGAKLNEIRLRVDSKRELAGTVIATGFPFKKTSLIPMQLAMMSNLLSRSR